MAATRTTRTQPIVHVDVDLGDTAIRLIEQPDGLFELDAPTDPGQLLVLTPDQMRAVVTTFQALGTRKGWT